MPTAEFSGLPVPIDWEQNVLKPWKKDCFCAGHQTCSCAEQHKHLPCVPVTRRLLALSAGKPQVLKTLQEAPASVPELGNWLHFAPLETLPPDHIFEDRTSPFCPLNMTFAQYTLL